MADFCSNSDMVFRLAAAPSRFFAAGIGDALATYFEARACYQSFGENLVLMKPSATGMGIAKLCYEVLLKNAVEAKIAVDNHVVTRAVEETIEATIYLSGVGAESGGLAAAHAIHNGMTAVESLHKAQHGEKVTFGLLAQLVLENVPREETGDGDPSHQSSESAADTEGSWHGEVRGKRVAQGRGRCMC